MNTSKISNTTSKLFKYFYNHVKDEDESARTYSSRNALCKGMRVTDLPTNNYEPLAASSGVWAMAKKYNRERELEEKIASLKAQCNGKSKEVVCLQDKLSEVQQNGERKINDLAKKLEEKELLLKKAKKFISANKGKLLKKEAEVEELNNELRLTKEHKSRLDEMNGTLENHVKELQEKLNSTTKQMQTNEAILESSRERVQKLTLTNTSLENHVRELQERQDEMVKQLEKKGSLLESSIEREEKLYLTNITLGFDVKELQDKLDETVKELQTTEVLLERSKDAFANLDKSNKSLSEQVVELQAVLADKDELYKHQQQEMSLIADNAENKLNKTSMEILRLTEELSVCKERERNLETTNKYLQLNVTELKENLDQMTNQQEKREKGNDATQEKCQTKLTGMKTSLNSFKGQTLLVEDKMKAECCSNSQPPPIALPTNVILEQPTRTFQANRFHGKYSVDAFSMKVTKASNDEGAVKLRIRAPSIPVTDDYRQVLESRCACIETDAIQANRAKDDSKKAVRINPFSVFAEFYDNSPLPIDSVPTDSSPKDAVQTHHVDDFSGSYNVNPYSMKAIKSAQGEASIKLRPSSPFIPETNVMIREVTHAPGADECFKKNIMAIPFSGIENEGCLTKLSKWFGF